MRSLRLTLTTLALAATGLRGQSQPAAVDHATMDHRAHMAMMSAAADPSPGVPGQAGQGAFAAIAEVVAILDADPSTDWSRVNLERLRQHLIDMDEMTLHAEIRQRPVPGGFEADVTGSGRTVAAVQRMVPAHAAMLAAAGVWVVRAEKLPAGVHLTVTARDPMDTAAVLRLRALGVAGLMVEGAHHGPHHLALARGEDPHQGH